ncbi:uncharacterized protein LOC111345935 [Stylophora pistillata]|uniref:uncharacterized protein LOC111345935 n=1 Tax=Stylophora pistillata TaxID=50429 RepID=UPI000C056B12|nr:uncharacterized protein LOC111345935 [Stylophora pistillata]
MDSMTARTEAEVLITPAPEVTENSSSQQEQSNPPLVDQVFFLFKTYLASQLNERSKQLEGKSKVVKEAAEFKFKGNRKQFELNALLDHIFGQIEVSLNEPQEIRKLVAEGRQLIKRRQKLIMWGISEEPTLSLFSSRIYCSKKQAEQRYAKSLTD